MNGPVSHGPVRAGPVRQVDLSRHIGAVWNQAEQCVMLFVGTGDAAPGAVPLTIALSVAEATLIRDALSLALMIGAGQHPVQIAAAINGQVMP